MTTPTPTPQEENLPEPAEETTPTPTPTGSTGFFHRVRRELNPKERPIHPSEEAEIVIMHEEDGDERTRY